MHWQTVLNRHAARAYRLESLQTIGLALFLHTVILYLAYLLTALIPAQEPIGFMNPALSNSSPCIAALLKWDAHWYTYVAEHGYTIQSIVFFPLLILLIKFLAFVGLDFGLSGFMLCNFFALASMTLMYITFRLDFSEQQTRRALLAYAVMPTAFFLNATYTEPLFITFSLACIYCARIEKWWFCGIFAALATLTRNIGIVLCLFMFYELWLVFRQKGKLQLTFFSLLLPPLALLLFISYNWELTGDPIAFIHSQQGWGRHFDWPWNNLKDNLVLLLALAPHVEAGMVLDSILVPFCFIGLLALSVWPGFKVRNSYLILGWLWFFVPLFSTSPSLPLYSMSRFILVIFPLYLFIAQLPRYCFYGYLWISSLTLLLCATLFMNWYWVG